MDFHSLPRRELQALCKRNKIAANLTNVAMADALQALPMVEGLDAIRELPQCQSPKKAAAGSPDPPPPSSRRTSARRRPVAPGSSAPQTRRGLARKADKNEERAEESDANFVPAAGIPNSPTTISALSARGLRTRTLIAVVLDEEEVEEFKKEEDKREQPPEVPKTPATRVTRGRGAQTQIAKLPTREQEGAEKKEDGGGALALHQTPAATTARRASTRKGIRVAASPAPEEATGARSTRCRTRQSARRTTEAGESALQATAARYNASARNKPANSESVGNVEIGRGDGGEEGAPARPPKDEKLEPSVVAEDPSGAPATEAEETSGADQTVVDSPRRGHVRLQEVQGPDSSAVDQTVEKALAGEGLVHQTALEGKSAEEKEVRVEASADPAAGEEEAVDDSVLRTARKAPAGDEGSKGSDATEMSGESDGSFDQTVLVEGPMDSSVQPAVDFEEDVDGSDRGAVNQKAEEEEVPETVVGTPDPTVQGVSEPGDVPEEALVPVEVDGHVDPTAAKIQDLILDGDVEQPEEDVEAGEIPSSEGEEAEATEVTSGFSVESLPETETHDAGVPAPASQAGEITSSEGKEAQATEEEISGLFFVKRSPENETHDADDTAPTSQAGEIASEVDEEEATAPEEETLGLFEGSDAGVPAPTFLIGGITASEGNEAEATQQQEAVLFSVESSPESMIRVAGLPAASVTLLLGGSTEERPAFDVQGLLQTEEHDSSNGLIEENMAMNGREEEKAIEEIFSAGDVPVAASVAKQLSEQSLSTNLIQQLADVICYVEQDKENSTVKECLSSQLVVGGAATMQGNVQQHQMTVVEYNGTTSIRKLKAAVKDKILQLRAMEEKKREKRVALTTLDEKNIMSPNKQKLLLMAND